MSNNASPGKPTIAINRKWRVGIVLGASIVVSLTAWWFLYRRASQLSFQARGWIVICGFANQTGEEVFDKSLDTALQMSLSQSSYINIIPRTRIEQTLFRMRIASDARLDETTGREIAKREKLKTVVTPRIEKEGDGYAVSYSLENPVTGAALQSKTIRVSKREEVLNALDLVADQIRRSLGELDATISIHNKPLKSVTTASLEALRQYALGMEKNQQNIFRQAHICFENALALDPNFVSAKALLGRIHYEASQAREQSGVIRYEDIDRDLGIKLMAEAVSQADHLTDRERYGIQAFYAREIENDVPKAAGLLKELIRLYPDDGAARAGLALDCRKMGRFDEAAAEYREILRLEPDLMSSYDSLIGVYLDDLGRVSDAIALCRAQISRNDKYVQAYEYLGWAYLGKGDLMNAREAFQKALKLNPRLTSALFRLGQTYRLQKKYQAALEPLQQIIDAEDPTVIYQKGLLLHLLNEKKLAEKHFMLYRDYVERDLRINPKDANAQMQLAVVLARLGQHDQAIAARDKGLSLTEKDYFGAALVSAVMGKYDDAMDRLELAVQKGYRNYIWMKIHPDLQGLYGNTKFEALLRKVLK